MPTPYTGLEPTSYQPLEGKWYEKVFQAIIIIVVSMLLISAPTIFFAGMSLVKNNFSVIFGQSVAVTLTLMIGIFLYRFRCRRPGWYGLFECTFGVTTAVYVANQLLSTSESPQKTQSIVLFFSWCAALYVIVRGLDNYHRSIVGTSREVWWKRWFFGLEIK